MHTASLIIIAAAVAAETRMFLKWCGHEGGGGNYSVISFTVSDTQYSLENSIPDWNFSQLYLVMLGIEPVTFCLITVSSLTYTQMFVLPMSMQRITRLQQFARFALAALSFIAKQSGWFYKV